MDVPVLLHVEDDDAASYLLTLALEELGIKVALHRVPNGEEALAFLRHAGKYAGAPRPNLILLDLNLPKVGGLEVLKEMHGDPALASVPVTVFTSSSRPSEKNAVLELGAQNYVTKPATFEAFMIAIQQVCSSLPRAAV